MVYRKLSDFLDYNAKHIIEMTERWKKLKNIGELFQKRTTINKYSISFSIFKKFLIIIKRKNLKYIINGIILARQGKSQCCLRRT